MFASDFWIVSDSRVAHFVENNFRIHNNKNDFEKKKLVEKREY